MLQKLHERGRLTTHSRCSEIERILEADSEFRRLRLMNLSSLFYAFVDALREKEDEDRRKRKTLDFDFH
jgi:hypothetical protein